MIPKHMFTGKQMMAFSSRNHARVTKTAVLTPRRKTSLNRKSGLEANTILFSTVSINNPIRSSIIEKCEFLFYAPIQFQVPNTQQTHQNCIVYNQSEKKIKNAVSQFFTGPPLILTLDQPPTKFYQSIQRYSPFE